MIDASSKSQEEDEALAELMEYNQILAMAFGAPAPFRLAGWNYCPRCEALFENNTGICPYCGWGSLCYGWN